MCVTFNTGLPPLLFLAAIKVFIVPDRQSNLPMKVLRVSSFAVNGFFQDYRNQQGLNEVDVL
jgi:hypothetical protein